MAHSQKHIEAAQYTPVRLVPDDIAEVLGQRPLLSGECPNRYDALFARFIVEFEPDGIIEWILLRDVHDLTWEIQRVRMLIAGLVDASRSEALSSDLDLICEDDPELKDQLMSAASRAWTLEAVGRQDLVAKSRGILNDYQLSLASMKASAVRHSMTELATLEKICASLERRRSKALNEFHAYRIQLRHLARMSVKRLMPQDDQA